VIVGEADSWVLLHGTPLTPQIWHDVAERLRPFGKVHCPPAVPVDEDRSQAPLAHRLLSEIDGNLQPRRALVRGPDCA
jgi:hypothetical protein